MLSKWMKQYGLGVLLVAVCGVPLQAQETATEEAPPSTEAADLPDGRQVIADHIEATGGEERLKNLESTVIEAELAIPGLGAKADVVITQVAPNRSHFYADIPQVGKIERCTDGTKGTAWEMHPMMGARLIEGDELKAALRDADVLAPLHPEKYYASVKCTELTEVNGRPSYKVEATLKEGGVETSYYDQETKLMNRMERKQKTPLGELKSTIDLSDYKEVQGMKFPYQTEVETFGQKQVITTKSVEVDQEVDMSKFEPPAEIKELMDGPEEDTSKG